MHIDVSRAHFHAKAQRLVLVRLPVDDRLRADAVKMGLLKKNTCGTRDAASNWERDGQEHVKSWREGGVNSGSARRICLVTTNIKYQEGHMVTASSSQDQQND